MKLVLFLALALVLVPAVAAPTASAIGPLCDATALEPLHCLPQCKMHELIITCEKWP